MEIIDELEPERRRSLRRRVGYVGWGAQNLDTAIAIRSAVVLRDRVVVQAGAGIVADSVPAASSRSRASLFVRLVAATTPTSSCPAPTPTAASTVVYDGIVYFSRWWSGQPAPEHCRRGNWPAH